MSALTIGLSAITTSQRLLDITGQNIANAATPGYHRQNANLAARSVGDVLGAGVYITDIRRANSPLLESAITRNIIEEQDVSAQIDTLRQVQVFLAPGEGSVDTLVEKFFNDVQQLTAKPGDLAQRRVVLGTARSLADRLNLATNELRKLSEDIDTRGREVVNNINTFTKQIADLNLRIKKARFVGDQPNDLLDQRDLLVQKLAGLIDIQVTPIDFDEVTILAAGAPVVIGSQQLDLQYGVDSNDQATFVRTDQSNLSLLVNGGQAGGLLTVRNGDLQDLRTRLDELSHSLVNNVDAIHSTGLGLTGPVSTIGGYRGITDPSAALATTNLAFPPQAGDLFVSVTETATGTRTLHKIAIDPATQSLNDVASAFGSITHLTGSVDTATNTLRVVADPGFAFDFAGRLPTAPENVSIAGTSTPNIQGFYTGSVNDTYTFTVTSTGTIGLTQGVTLEVRDSANTLIGAFNIGQGYEPGSIAGTVNGVQVRIGAGTVNGGDTFQTQVVASADTAKILPALGVNTFFIGDSASSIAVRPDLLTNPELLGASRSGASGDSSNLLALGRLREQRTLAGGTANFREFYGAIVGDVGVRVQTLSSNQDAQQALGQRLQAEQQSASGVDPNEELVKLLQYQRQFQMAARYVAVVNETLDSLLQLAQ